jgi:hypothetical protein
VQQQSWRHLLATSSSLRFRHFYSATGVLFVCPGASLAWGIPEQMQGSTETNKLLALFRVCRSTQQVARWQDCDTPSHPSCQQSHGRTRVPSKQQPTRKHTVRRNLLPGHVGVPGGLAACAGGEEATPVGPVDRAGAEGGEHPGGLVLLQLRDVVPTGHGVLEAADGEDAARRGLQQTQQAKAATVRRTEETTCPSPLALHWLQSAVRRALVLPVTTCSQGYATGCALVNTHDVQGRMQG